MIDWLKNEWYNLVKNYSDNVELINSLWSKIERQYSSKSRHYHDLSHIYNMLKLTKENQSKIKNFDEFQFAVWYHDLIYKVTKKNNEENSAEEAKKDLSFLKLND